MFHSLSAIRSVLNIGHLKYYTPFQHSNWFYVANAYNLLLFAIGCIVDVWCGYKIFRWIQMAYTQVVERRKRDLNYQIMVAIVMQVSLFVNGLILNLKLRLSLPSS